MSKKRVTVRLDKHYYDALTLICQQEGLSKSATIQHLIRLRSMNVPDDNSIRNIRFVRLLEKLTKRRDISPSDKLTAAVSEQIGLLVEKCPQEIEIFKLLYGLNSPQCKTISEVAHMYDVPLEDIRRSESRTRTRLLRPGRFEFIDEAIRMKGDR